jgi:hypothetical protein
MLTGRSATASPSLVFYDSWEMAGDSSSGYTWSTAIPSPSWLVPGPALRPHLPPGARWRGTRPLCAARCPRTLARPRYPTTTGWSRTFATEPSDHRVVGSVGERTAVGAGRDQGGGRRRELTGSPGRFAWGLRQPPARERGVDLCGDERRGGLLPAASHSREPYRRELAALVPRPRRHPGRGSA